jgi:regulatory protein
MAPSAPIGPDAVEARAQALRFLGRREYSRLELSRKLAQRGVVEATAREVVEDLAQDGLVSDERFAEVFCRQRVERFQGPLKIRAELRARGVDDGIVTACLSPYEDQWRDLALAWIGKRASATPDRKEKARLYRGGCNRGFTHEQILSAIDRHRRGC